MIVDVLQCIVNTFGIEGVCFRITQAVPAWVEHQNNDGKD